MRLVYVGLGGCLGAIARYLLGGYLAEKLNAPSFPWATFAINVSGCLLLGFLGALAWERFGLPLELRLALMTGFLGAYTTFSTWNLETWQLLQTGSLPLAGWNVIGSTVAGLAATWIGFVCGKSV